MTAAGERTAALPGDAKVLKGVPFFRQEDFQCGPAALATVVNYWYGRGGGGRHLSLSDTVAHTYSPSARGVLGIDLELYARRLGFETAQRTGGIDDLRHAIDDGVPVIILVDYGFSVYRRSHFMVVTGYSEDGVIVNSGRSENEVIPNGDLVRIWKKTDFWSLVVKPSP